MTRSRLMPGLSIFIAFLILLSLCLQYPFSTTFPIGGDAASYIKRAQAVLEIVNNPSESFDVLRVAWYPLSLVIFSSSAVIPTDWPTRFIWYMTASHIITGLILARLLYKISGWRASALVMIIWAITTTGITGHVEDGTLAHLMSFMFLALFLERLSSGATWTTLIALVATALAHPVNGLSLLVVITIVTPILFSTWSKLNASRKKQIAIICPASALMLVLVVFAGKSVFANAANVVGVANNPFIDILVSRFAPFVALSPLGLLVLLKSNQSTNLKFIIATLFSLSAIMAGNDLLGISVWSDRLSPLFIFMVTILAALGLSSIIQSVFTGFVARTLFITLFISLVSVSAWRSNMHVFEFYENTNNYARLHPDELAAIHWMQNNLSADSLIITIHNNRHAEWIPALTQQEWLPVSENDTYFSNSASNLSELPDNNKLKYVVFFTLRQNISEKYLLHPDKYPQIFSNEGITIFNIPPQQNDA